MSNEKTQILKDLVEKRRTWEFFGWERHLGSCGLVLSLGAFISGMAGNGLFMTVSLMMAGTLAPILAHFGPWASHQTRNARLSLWWVTAGILAAIALNLGPIMGVYSYQTGSILSLFLMAGNLGAMALVKRRWSLGFSGAILGFGSFLFPWLGLPVGFVAAIYFLGLSFPFFISTIRNPA